MRGFGLHTYFTASSLKIKLDLNQYGGGGVFN